MNKPAPVPVVPTEAVEKPRPSGRLFRRYAAFFVAVVCLALISNTAMEVWFYLREYRTLLLSIQRAQALATAIKIEQFVKEIESHLGWTTQSWSAASADEWRLDAARLLRQVPAITEFSKLDASGRERLQASRLAPDTVESGKDFASHPIFIEARTKRIAYGPVYFRSGSEPYMTLAVTDGRAGSGVSLAEINLKFIWDVVSTVTVGERGQAYVVDKEGRLIAHPDLSLVLRNTDLSRVAYVQAARAEASTGAPDERVQQDISGRSVLSAYTRIESLGWLVFFDLPLNDALEALRVPLLRTGLHLLAALILAVLAGLYLARRMTEPVRTLRIGAIRIGHGDLGHRISIRTGDDLEALGEQFNRMTAQLQESYATLERKVEERTSELALANLAKSRFLAAASHDLRQPLHALGLFVSQLRGHVASAESKRLVDRIDAAVTAMNELFAALLDISKLDAGVLSPDVTDFPIARLLGRIETTFTGAADEKGLSLRVIPSNAFVRSDPILLERIVLNLVSNAVRYTAHGGVVVGCRRRGDTLRIEVYDTGPGIAEDERRKIFAEFYRAPQSGGSRESGLGLGLSIVERLCGLLGHSIEVDSAEGRGSRFAVTVARVAAPAAVTELAPPRPVIDAPSDKLLVVIDDDALLLDSMAGLLRGWGCRVVAARSLDAALATLAAEGGRPDLIISDYRLADGYSGIAAIERLRAEFGATIPAFLISGDTAPERLQEARASGHHLLHKPVRPMALRAILTQLLKRHETADATA